MDGGFSLQIQGLKPLAKITRSHWDRDMKRPKAAVVHKHLVLFKFRRRGKKQGEWLLHDLAQMGHGFCRSELQRSATAASRALPAASMGAFFLRIQGLKPLATLARSRWGPLRKGSSRSDAQLKCEGQRGGAWSLSGD